MCKPRTIFQALRGGALDVYSDGEPYWIEDSAGRVIPRELVSRRRVTRAGIDRDAAKAAVL